MGKESQKAEGNSGVGGSHNSVSQELIHALRRTTLMSPKIKNPEGSKDLSLDPTSKRFTLLNL
jgi:hypothetical protein